MADASSAQKGWLDTYFGISDRGSSVAIEFRAGVATFLSLSYIFVLAPTLLEAIGLDAHDSLIAVIVLSVVATFVTGVFARVPFAFAPGLEMLLYVTYVAISIRALNPANALLSVSASGIILTVFAVLRITRKIHNYPPVHFPQAVAISMSAFLLLMAFRIDGLLSYQRGWVDVVSSPSSHWILGLTGAVVAIILDAVGIPAPILISLLLVAILAGPAAITPGHANVSIGAHRWLRDASQLVFTPQQIGLSLTATFTLFVLSMYGSLSKVINIWEGAIQAQTTGRVAHKEGDYKNLMVVEGGAAFLSGVAGISNVTMFVESGAGIRVGARTGLASVVTSILMISAVSLIPYIRHINPIAAVGALIYIGILLFPRPNNLRRVSQVEWGIIGGMVLIVALWMSLAGAFIFGFLGFEVARHYKKCGGEMLPKSDAAN